MSRSARRLSATVTTNRFAWQDHGPESSLVVPMVLHGGPAEPVSIASAMRDLPSPSADRIEALERETFARGYAEGERAGAVASSVRIDSAVARFEETLREIAALRTAVMQRSERELVRLAVSMAERILRREIEVDRELLVAMARVAIDRLGENCTATIHLNPADHEAVTVRPQELGRSIELVSDPSIARGGCLIRSPFGAIDVGIESQIRELSGALLGDDAGDERERTDSAVAGV